VGGGGGRESVTLYKGCLRAGEGTTWSIGCVIGVIESLGCGRGHPSRVCECDRVMAGSKGGVGAG
jgi:hypothetical protein